MNVTGLAHEYHHSGVRQQRNQEFRNSGAVRPTTLRRVVPALPERPLSAYELAKSCDLAASDLRHAQPQQVRAEPPPLETVRGRPRWRRSG